MKANELMIGDWVYLYNSPIKINIDDLGVIDRDDIYDNGEHCKPIPITPEILEKNGFIQCGEDSLYPQYNECTHKFSDNRGHVVLLEYIGWSHGYYSVHDITTIHDVHELQHIFKIKKIKKDIVI